MSINPQHQHISGERNLTPLHQIVLYHLCECALTNDEPWPGKPALAKRCGISKRTLDKALADLEGRNYITAYEGGVGRGNRIGWVLHIPSGDTPRPDKIGPSPIEEKVQSTTEKVQELHLLELEKVQSTTRENPEKVQSTTSHIRLNYSIGMNTECENVSRHQTSVPFPPHGSKEIVTGVNGESRPSSQIPDVIQQAITELTLKTVYPPIVGGHLLALWNANRDKFTPQGFADELKRCFNREVWIYKDSRPQPSQIASDYLRQKEIADKFQAQPAPSPVMQKRIENHRRGQILLAQRKMQMRGVAHV